MDDFLAGSGSALRASATLVFSMAASADPKLVDSMVPVWAITPSYTPIGRRSNQLAASACATPHQPSTGPLMDRIIWSGGAFWTVGICR